MGTIRIVHDAPEKSIEEAINDLLKLKVKPLITPDITTNDHPDSKRE